MGKVLGAYPGQYERLFLFATIKLFNFAKKFALEPFSKINEKFMMIPIKTLK
jgi:hypothetical protein